MERGKKKVEEIEYNFGNHRDFLFAFHLLLTRSHTGRRTFCGDKLILPKTSRKVDVKFIPNQARRDLDFVRIRFLRGDAGICAIQATVDGVPRGWHVYSGLPNFEKSNITGIFERYPHVRMANAIVLPFNSRYSDLLRYIYFHCGMIEEDDECPISLAEMMIERDDLRKGVENLIRNPTCLGAVAFCLYCASLFVTEPIRSWEISTFINNCMENNLCRPFGRKNLAFLRNWEMLCTRVIFDKFVKPLHPDETTFLPEEINCYGDLATQQVRVIKSMKIDVDFCYELRSCGLVRFVDNEEEEGESGGRSGDDDAETKNKRKFIMEEDEDDEKDEAAEEKEGENLVRKTLRMTMQKDESSSGCSF